MKTMLAENINMVRKIAWKFSEKVPGMDFDDIFSEACVIYLEGEKSFDPSKGTKRSTFLWVHINNELNNMVSSYINKISKRDVSISVDDMSFRAAEGDPEESLFEKQEWEDMLSMLSPEARAICGILLYDPSFFLPIGKPKLCRSKIKDLLRDQGWSWGAIWKSYREINEALKIAHS